mmetsp:Transcript_7214/g.21995  ORF Transcript_7214/g.21995 Transcript_7214/m.21995 type:complete len:228 (-) Transcript_7214:231-914(-)
MVVTMVRPRSAKCLSVCITFRALNESSPLVGSSRKMRDGLVTSSVPMLTRFLSPPLTPRFRSLPMYESFTWLKPNSVITASAFSRRCFSLNFFFGSLRFAENLICSVTVTSANMLSSCSTYAESLLKTEKSRLRPLTMTLPEVRTLFEEVSLPARRFSSVVFPAPEEPMMARICPGNTSPLTLLRMTFSDAFFPGMHGKPFVDFATYCRSCHCRCTGWFTAELTLFL